MTACAPLIEKYIDSDHLDVKLLGSRIQDVLYGTSQTQWTPICFVILLWKFYGGLKEVCSKTIRERYHPSIVRYSNELEILLEDIKLTTPYKLNLVGIRSYPPLQKRENLLKFITCQESESMDDPRDLVVPTIGVGLYLGKS